MGECPHNWPAAARGHVAARMGYVWQGRQEPGMELLQSQGLLRGINAAGTSQTEKPRPATS